MSLTARPVVRRLPFTMTYALLLGAGSFGVRDAVDTGLSYGIGVVGSLRARTA